MVWALLFLHRLYPHRLTGVLSYRILDHTADTGIEASADSLASLIDQLATGMFALMAPVEPCPEETTVEVEVAAPTLEDLIVDVLSELLYEAEINDLILCGFHTTLLGPTRARVKTGAVATSDVDLAGPPIKAVTYHDLTVSNTDGSWFGRVYFDV